MEIIFIRTIILFIVATALLRLMGKRQLGELEPYEVVITIMIAELAMTPMDDTRNSLFFGLIPIITLFILHTFISYFSLKLIWFRNIISGKETLVIDNGCLIIENMRKNDYSMDELMEQLRDKGIFDIDEVAFAVIESGGTLSVLKKPEYTPALKSDIGYKPFTTRLPMVIITCGKFQKECNFDKNDFLNIAKKNGFLKQSEIFYASLSSQNKLFIQGYGKKQVILDLGENYAS